MPREEEPRAQRLGHPGMARELLAVVGRDRVHGERARHAGHGRADRVRRLPPDPFEQRVLGRPVHQGDKRAAGALAVDSCPPPGRRPVPSPPRRPGARRCPPGPGCGRGPRGPRPSSSASCRGGGDAARDRRRPSGRRGCARRSTAGPPSARPPCGGARRPAPGPALGQPLLRHAPQLRRHLARHRRGRAAAPVRLALGLLVAVAAPAGVAPHLAPDRRAVAAELAGDRRTRKPAFPQGAASTPKCNISQRGAKPERRRSLHREA